MIRPARIDRLVARFRGAAPTGIAVYAQAESAGEWIEVARGQGAQVTFGWPDAWMHADTIVERLKVELAFASGLSRATLTDVLLYPSEVSRTVP